MEILNPGLDIHRYFPQRGKAEKRLLFLDYDGTLAPFSEDRDQAFPYPGVKEAIKRIMALPGSRIVIISGRQIEDLIPLLGLENLPEIWGAHGRQRLKSNGELSCVPLTKDEKQGMSAVRELLISQGMWDLVETKPGCLAVHTRGLSPRKASEIENKIRQDIYPATKSSGLELHTFDGGLEIRGPGCDKGRAVETIISKLDSPVKIAYLGDDLTDEDAFKFLKGRGLCVLVRKRLRPTAADLWIKPPEELLLFLRLWEKGGENGSIWRPSGGGVKPPAHNPETEKG